MDLDLGPLINRISGPFAKHYVIRTRKDRSIVIARKAKSMGLEQHHSSIQFCQLAWTYLDAHWHTLSHAQQVEWGKCVIRTRGGRLTAFQTYKTENLRRLLVKGTTLDLPPDLFKTRKRTFIQASGKRLRVVWQGTDKGGNPIPAPPEPEVPICPTPEDPPPYDPPAVAFCPGDCSFMRPGLHSNFLWKFDNWPVLEAEECEDCWAEDFPAPWSGPMHWYEAVSPNDYCGWDPINFLEGNQGGILEYTPIVCMGADRYLNYARWIFDCFYYPHEGGFFGFEVGSSCSYMRQIPSTEDIPPAPAAPLWGLYRRMDVMHGPAMWRYCLDSDFWPSHLDVQATWW